VADAASDHRTHDPEAIAALAGDRAPDADARRAEAARCPDCAALLDDLRLLAMATHTLEPPSRTRDFRLDPATAASLVARPPEPEPAPGRLGREMTTPAPDHAAHDPVLVAAYRDGRLDDGDRDRVDAWLAGCGACAELKRDLDDLILATRALPTPARPRDFTLSPEDARRAHSRGWRRLVAVIGSPRDTLSKPLALGLTTLGIAGLIVANGSSMLSFGSAAGSATGPAAAAPEVKVTDASAAPAYADNAASAPSVAESTPSEPSGVDTMGGEPSAESTGAATAEPSADPSDLRAAAISRPTDPAHRDETRDGAYTEATLATDETGGASWLVIGSALMLLVGLTLALLRWGARRLGDG
jgi:anti-sigma factor RsiW